jgi:hypothetical protein
MEDMGKVEPSGFTGRTVLDIHWELIYAKRTFWFFLVACAMSRFTENMARSNPSLGAISIIFWVGVIVALFLHVRGVACAATAAGYSPARWGILSALFPIAVWFLNGRIKRQYGICPKVG